MAKQRIQNYVFLPGVSRSENLFPNAHELINDNKEFLKKEASAFIADSIINETLENLFPNAVALLTNNKTFLQEEITAWIAAQVLAGSPSFTGYTYDSAKCKRDVGYVIDAYIHDLRYGGNEKTSAVSKQYWISGTPQIDGNRAPEVEAHTQLKNIINTYIFTKTLYTSQQSPVIATQNTSGTDGEAGASTIITALSTRLTNVIANGLSIFVTSPITNSQYPFAAYIYDQSKCERDVGYVLDAYLNDLRYGGNAQIRHVSSRYWNGLLPQVDGSREPEIVTHEFIRDLINDVIINGQSYTPLQTEVNLDINPSLTPEIGVNVRITTLTTILTDVISGGLDSLPALVNGVTTIKVQGHHTLEDLLLITNTTNNQIIYNFSDPQLGGVANVNTAYNSNGYYTDDDFPAFLQTSDYVTTLTLDADTSTSSSTDSIQMFVEMPEIKVRPYDFGTDAIERMRIAAPQSMLDADFEYGLQPTKWQAIGLSRGYPSVYEVPGTDTSVVTVTTDASIGTGGVGESLITVTTTGPHGFTIGTPITVRALANTITGFSRAEGTFIINSVPSTTTFTYYAVAKVGTSNGQILATSYTQLRKAAFYTGASLGTPAFSVYSNGSASSFTSEFNTILGSDQVAFSGTAPSIGAPLTGTGIASGSQVSGVVGSGGIAVTAALATNALIGETEIEVSDATGILEGMAIDNGNGTSTFVSSIAGTTVNLTAPLTAPKVGNTANFVNVPGTNINPIGAGAVFSVTRTIGEYSNVTPTTAGSNYQVDDRILILGTDLDGASPANDLTITVTGIDGGGGVTAVAFNGDSVSGDAVYTGVAQTSVSGSGSTFNVTVSSTAYSVTLANAGSSYTVGQTVTLSGANLGGATPANDLTITVTAIDGAGPLGGISTFSFVGTGSSTDGTYTGVAPYTTSGSGATFNVDRTAGSYTPTLSLGGAGYAVGQQITISGANLGGSTPTNDLIITVGSISGAGPLGPITSITYSGTAISSDFTFTLKTGNNVLPIGANATFNITKTGTSYNASVNVSGSNYFVGERILILGTDLGGSSPTHDATLTITTVSGGQITGITIAGSGPAGTSVDFYSSISFTEITTALIPAGTTISSTAIALMEVTFTTAHGLIPGAGIMIDISSAGTNHELAKGPFYVEQVPSTTKIRYTARTAGTIDETTSLSGIVYTRADSYFIHRPYDGGVQLGTGGPQHGAQAIRMSKKYIRYQSGKGIMYTTGALFAPSYNIQSLTSTGTAIGSFITLVTDDVDHGCQVGGVIKIIGVDTSGYNGSYTITDVVNERTLKVQAQSVLANTIATLGTTAQMSLQEWHGASVRAGTYDDQNGMFWQYNGKELSVVRRSSTFQLVGVADIARDGNLLTGTNTRFRDQVKAGDKIVIKGMTHTVTNVLSQTSMTVNPDYRGASNAVQAKICLVQDLVVPQSQFNIDRLDGTGPSGYQLDISKMQMIGMQWTWYGAGFIDYMLRGSDGNYVFCHRIRNSNVNTEAYMRTGNMPVRYEVINESAIGKLASSITATQTTIPLMDASNFPNESGIVYIDNELIAFNGKSGNTLTGCTRAAPMVNFVGGAQRTFTASTAVTHEYNTGVVLVSNTISPIISHWGSAMLTDGRFDEDRGYIFNYAATNVSITTTRQTAFLIRLAPSVSNAIVGDLGDRELLNRAQLLLKEIAITSDTGTGGIVVEGVLNPQNYPANVSDITWTGLQSSAQGGQPSFAQIAPGGSVVWSSASQTTAAVTSQAFLTGSITVSALSWRSNRGIQNGDRYLALTQSNYNTYIANGLAAGDRISGTGIAANTTIQSIAYWYNDGTLGPIYYLYLSQAANQNVNGNATLTVTKAYPLSNTSTMFFQKLSWESAGAKAGTEVSDVLFPAGTFVNTSSLLSYFGTQYYRVTFNQTSTSTAITAGTTTITFKFGAAPYAQPGETVFSFIAAPSSNSVLSLSDLKELTNTTLGGRGTYPNGPDVLAINVYKATGAAINCNIVLRWGEAQA
jgi:hypothetical protein